MSNLIVAFQFAMAALGHADFGRDHECQLFSRSDKPILRHEPLSERLGNPCPENREAGRLTD